MTMQIELSAGDTAFRPGHPIEGVARWSVMAPPKSVELRLFWYTQGKGTQDVRIAEREVDHGGSPRGEMSFSFSAPEGPYSFSGKLISLTWALELVAIGADETERLELVIGPEGREVVIGYASEG